MFLQNSFLPKMASLQGQIVSPHRFLLQDPILVPFAHKTNNLPPKSEASTATTLGSKRTMKLTQNNLQKTQIVLASENPKRFSHAVEEHSLFSSCNEVDYIWSILNEFMANRNCSFDCKQVHCQVVKLGVIEWDYMVGNRLALLYLKKEGSLDYARRVFDEMPERTLPLYAAIIGLYCRAERWEEAFSILGLMILDDMLPDLYLVPTILKACAAVQLLGYGKMVHGFVIKKECFVDLFVGNGLIDLYGSCGDLRYARRVFDIMTEKDVVSWTALISAYMDGGFPSEACDVFRTMRLNGVKPDLISWNSLVSGLARNGEILLAFSSLEEMQEQGLNLKVTSWNGLISGCVFSGYYNDALNAFGKMLLSLEKPNAMTIASILPACASLKALEVAKAIHGYAIKMELCGNIYVQGCLMDMYSKCGRNDSMEKVFKHVKSKNTTLWNEMIKAYVNEGKMEAALGLLESMRRNGSLPDQITYNTLLAGHARKRNKNEAYALISEMSNMGIEPNIVSFNALISGFQQSGLSYEALKLFRTMRSPSANCFAKEASYDALIQANPVATTSAIAACADLSFLRNGKEIHGHVLKNNLEHDMLVSSALVNMYAKCHDMSSATKVFHKMENRNRVAWNSLISPLVEHLRPA